MRLFSFMLATSLFVLFGLSACGNLSDVGSHGLPSGVQDPATFRTPAGALGMYQATVVQFQHVFPKTVLITGLLSDELQSSSTGGSIYSGYTSAADPIDVRILPDGQASSLTDLNYIDLQQVRSYAIQAIGALQKYNPDAPPALRGEAYALAGYAELFLAEVFCSGIPLSTLEFEKDYVYHAGSTTQEVYQHAILLFDSAMVLASDSARIMNLARVGQGRAFLALGNYTAATGVVGTVPDTFRYQFPVTWNGLVTSNSDFPLGNVADREGLTGLAYRTSGDPRTSAIATGTNVNGVPQYFPAKYNPRASATPIVVASGVEARLIEAEAALQAQPNGLNWLTILNALRTTAITPVLPVLSDPGTPSARIDTLFAERARWLFITGIRHGDLRRLVRNYGRSQNAVYPSGPYSGYPGTYGQDVTAPIPLAERANPLFTGCFNRGA